MQRRGCESSQDYSGFLSKDCTRLVGGTELLIDYVIVSEIAKVLHNWFLCLCVRFRQFFFCELRIADFLFFYIFPHLNSLIYGFFRKLHPSFEIRYLLLLQHSDVKKKASWNSHFSWRSLTWLNLPVSRKRKWSIYEEGEGGAVTYFHLSEEI